MSKALPSNASALERLFLACNSKRKLKKRDVVIPYLEGERCLYMVAQGSLRVALSNLESEGVVCISHLKPGDIFGEQGLFDCTPAPLTTATIEARTDAQLLSVSHEKLKRAAVSLPSIYTELSSLINQRLGETTEKLLQLVFDDLELRCYKSLIEITRLPDALTHPNGMQISLTRIELAQMAGCNRESAGRVLRVLRAKGMIEASGSRIVVVGIRHGEPIRLKANEVASCV
ncbi:cyclic nucleotide-binding domain-containing protein [Pseudomonas syringae pv. actinidiae]|nr:cyclic nucleotide-binding domain-containing protein [Pseudomonas syringae pv. actinidiae]